MAKRINYEKERVRRKMGNPCAKRRFAVENGDALSSGERARVIKHRAKKAAKGFIEWMKRNIPTPANDVGPGPDTRTSDTEY